MQPSLIEVLINELGRDSSAADLALVEPAVSAGADTRSDAGNVGFLI
jgi:hypothetical protein